MVKDLQYFINAENEFCKEHPDYGELFFDTSIGEMSEQGIDDRLNYLSDRIISNCNKIIKEPSEKELEFKLSDVQRVLLRLFLGKYSYIFRDDYYYEGIMHIPADTRSAFPVISVQSPVSIQCCWQS